MLLAEAACLFTGVILYISGVQGRVHRICALNGSSVDLPCSTEHPSASINLYTVHWDGSTFVVTDLSGDGNSATYIAGKRKATVTMNDLRESDSNFYCCGNITDKAAHCWSHRVELNVTDLQVKVIPATEGQTVTLMCSTSCPLTETPAAYIWYKNGEFLYEDWSPWYQQLVSSEEAVRYSCAIKGYEDLRAPEVSVDSVTSTCFTVTYAKGRMCSYKQTSEDGSCSITYPTEVYVQKTPAESPVTLTCRTSCPLTDSQAADRWYRTQQFPVSSSFVESFSCAVKDHDGLLSAEVCVQGQTNIICALKGSSVDLPCSAEHPTSMVKWYTVHQNDSSHELSPKGNRVTYNMIEGSNYTLTINDLRESDANFYCCRENTDQPQLWRNGTKLHVADLQVKVIPATEGQTVTLMCSTSCPLTETPAAYIWYKNGEFLYQDWSPWYQQLVSSEEAVRYSCAIKGYEDLRAPEVSVDSVTSTCFTVTYAKGKMCSYKQTSEDEPCSITYPTEVHVQKTKLKSHTILTCNTSCPMADPHTAYRWYWNRVLNSHCENQDITLFRSNSEIYSCAVKGHEDLHSGEDCVDDENCWSVNYVNRRICALQGSSVDITSEYSYPKNQLPQSTSWYIKKRSNEDADELIDVKYYDNLKIPHILSINNLKKNDSAEYTFRLQQINQQLEQSELAGVTLVVTGLEVMFTPAAVMTEFQRVTLTCSTSCPLTDDIKFIWYLNGRPLTLPENQNKHLVLDPVRCHHAGNYSCAVETHNNISSPIETLTVNGEYGFKF
uniref:Ig-like domain-containing protein n=2 Tax=Dicentrarchus labrax TaxID=13489 RepID=A0A8C4DI58_DICLA